MFYPFHSIKLSAPNIAAQVALTIVHAWGTVQTMTTKHKSKQSVPVSKLAYSYRRYSSSNQSNNSSLPRQLELAQEICAEKCWTLVDLPPDEGVSAFKGVNKVKGTLGQFLNKVKAGE